MKQIWFAWNFQPKYYMLRLWSIRSTPIWFCTKMVLAWSSYLVVVKSQFLFWARFIFRLFPWFLGYLHFRVLKEAYNLSVKKVACNFVFKCWHLRYMPKACAAIYVLFPTRARYLHWYPTNFEFAPGRKSYIGGRGRVKHFPTKATPYPEN